jgi:membrane protease YdiL (CAAX protease family)
MRTTKQTSDKAMTWLFISATYSFSWLFWLPAVLSTRDLLGEVPWPPLFAIGTCGPLMAALWCIQRSSGWVGVRHWVKQKFGSCFSWRWWGFILLTPFIVPVLVLAVYYLSGGIPYPLPFFQNPLMVFPTIFLMVTIGGGQEEYGWRGYLLERLQERWKPWQADLILTGIHSFWHLPLFFIAVTAQSTYPFWVFLAFGIGFTPLINGIYRQTDGSLLAAILFHGLVNAGLDTFPPIGPAISGANWPFLLVGLCYIILALAIRPRGDAQ